MGLLDKAVRKNHPGNTSSGNIKTFLDRVYEQVQRGKSVSLNDIALKHKISIKEAEKWSKLLQRQGLVEVDYPAVGEANVSLIEEKNEAIERSTDDGKSDKRAGSDKIKKLVVFALICLVVAGLAIFMMTKVV